MPRLHLSDQIFILRMLAFLWLGLTMLIDQESPASRAWALMLCLYPFVIWRLHTGLSFGVEPFQCYFVIDALIVAGSILLFPLAFLTKLAAMSAMVTSASLCLGKQAWQSRCIRLLLVMAVVVQPQAFLDGFKALGLEQSLALGLLFGFGWAAASLVYRASSARSDIYWNTKAEQDRAVGQIDSVRPYLTSPSLLEYPLQKSSEQRTLTIFIADLVDSTAVAEMHQDDLFAEFLNAYISCMGQLVLRFGGTLDKFTGDGLVVIFGLNGSTPALAARGCADMALAMRPALNGLLLDWQCKLARLPRGQRMGIHTGNCSVGSFGCPERLNYTALGRTVHIAARLEQLAAPNEILVSAETAALLDDHHTLENRHPAKVQGFRLMLNHSALID